MLRHNGEAVCSDI